VDSTPLQYAYTSRVSGIAGSYARRPRALFRVPPASRAVSSGLARTRG
jgi:hypothetical protein